MPKRWDEYAALRRRQIESGIDLTFSNIFVPWYRDFIRLRRPRTLLEVDAGTGHLSSSLIDLVGDIVAIEPSDGMYAVASEVLKGSAVDLHK